MSKDNLTAIQYGINDIRLEQTPIEEPNDDEVLLEIQCVGICGSDLHYVLEGRIGDFVVREPMIMGHETSGRVAKCGSKVKNLKVGDRVAIEPGVPCRYCNYCKEGRYNLCQDIIFCATPPCHGTLRRYYKHAADFCYKIPDHMSFEEAALLEPLSVGVYACERANITFGSKVLITGAGPIGLVNLLVAKAMGASKIILTDLDQSRLDFAKKMGADDGILVQRSDTEKDLVERVKKAFGGEPDRTIDASGAKPSIRLGLLVTKPGGIVVIVGMGAPEVEIPLTHALCREVEIKGLFRYVNNYPTALELVASGRVNVKPLVTHNFTLEQTKEAFETAKKGTGVIKIMIHVGK